MTDTPLPSCKGLDLRGKRFGRLTVVEYAGIGGRGSRKWKCLCDCGTIKCIVGGSLRAGRTKSCGCLSREAAARTGKAKRVHGKTGSQEYVAWSKIKRRCYVSECWEYHRYGGRGITMSPEWRMSFSAFYQDMGDKPSAKHSIDRIDNDGNYEKGNCRWATHKEQCNNRRDTVYLTHNGVTKPVVYWAEQLGIAAHTLRQRLRLGWSHQKALTTKVNTNYG